MTVSRWIAGLIGILSLFAISGSSAQQVFSGGGCGSALSGAIAKANGSCVTTGSAQAPTQQRFVSGSGATYTTPANATLLVVTTCAGGGGGGGSGGTNHPTGTTGTTSTFNSINAVGGTGGIGTTNATGGAGGAGGTGGTGSATWRVAGQVGAGGTDGVTSITANQGGHGGYTLLGPVGAGGNGATGAAATQGGSGGGGGGECFQLRITSPASTYTYTVGGGGGGGVGTGTGAATGVTGATGVVQVDEYYQPISGIGTYTTTTGITAAGTTLGTCTALTTNVNVISTVSSGTGVCLPTAIAGLPAYVMNQGANMLNVWPSNGSTQIGVLGNGVAVGVASGATAQFQATSTTQWYTQP